MMTNCCHFSNFNKSEMLRLKCASIGENESLTYSRNQSTSYQANSMANPYAESGLLVNRLVSPQWWNLLFHSCQSFHPNASCAVDERLDAMSNIGQWYDLSSDNGCKSFAFSLHVAFAWKVSWKWTFSSNILKHDGYWNHKMCMVFFHCYMQISHA